MEVAGVFYMKMKNKCTIIPQNFVWLIRWIFTSFPWQGSPSDELLKANSRSKHRAQGNPRPRQVDIWRGTESIRGTARRICIRIRLDEERATKPTSSDYLLCIKLPSRYSHLQFRLVISHWPDMLIALTCRGG